jgi:hypothetical protein
MIIREDRTIATQVKLRSVIQKAKFRDARQNVNKSDNQKVFLALKKVQKPFKKRTSDLELSRIEEQT